MTARAARFVVDGAGRARLSPWGGPPGGGADCAACPNPASTTLYRACPTYRRTGGPATSEHRRRCGNGDRRSPGRGRRRWPRRRSSSSSRARHRASARSRIEDDARQAADAGWRWWSPAQRQRCRDGRLQEHITSSIAARTWAPASTDLVICKAIAGRTSSRDHFASGPRQRRRALNPPTTGNQPGSQAASQQCHARRRHRLPGNRQARGSMRLVSVTVRPALHAAAATWVGSASAPAIRIPPAAAPASTSNRRPARNVATPPRRASTRQPSTGWPTSIEILEPSEPLR